MAAWSLGSPQREMPRRGCRGRVAIVGREVASHRRRFHCVDVLGHPSMALSRATTKRDQSSRVRLVDGLIGYDRVSAVYPLLQPISTTPTFVVLCITATITCHSERSEESRMFRSRHRGRSSYETPLEDVDFRFLTPPRCVRNDSCWSYARVSTDGSPEALNSVQP